MKNRQPGDDLLELFRSLTNQAPKSDAVVDRFEELRLPAKDFGATVLELCPPSRERSLAITKLEESLMWAIKSIALNQDDILDEHVDADQDPADKMAPQSIVSAAANTGRGVEEIDRMHTRMRLLDIAASRGGDNDMVLARAERYAKFVEGT